MKSMNTLRLIVATHARSPISALGCFIQKVRNAFSEMTCIGMGRVYGKLP